MRSINLLIKPLKPLYKITTHTLYHPDTKVDTNSPSAQSDKLLSKSYSMLFFPSRSSKPHWKKIDLLRLYMQGPLKHEKRAEDLEFGEG
jgi:hypothetical protein